MSAPSAGLMMKQLLRRLRNADRETFQLLINALDVYTIEAMDALTSAPQDQILAQQGRAQQCQAFLRLFNECHLDKTPPMKPQPDPNGGSWQAP